MHRGTRGGKKCTMFPGWPQWTSQPGRFHDFTSSTKGLNRDVTVEAELNDQVNMSRIYTNEADDYYIGIMNCIQMRGSKYLQK